MLMAHLTSYTYLTAVVDRLAPRDLSSPSANVQPVTRALETDKHSQALANNFTE